MSLNAGELLGMVGITVDENAVEHHGVKGMKWGVRRKTSGGHRNVSVSEKVFDGQNRRITLTVTGRNTRDAKRNLKKSIENSDDLRRPTKQEAKAIKAETASGASSGARPKNTFSNKPTNRRASDAELRAAVNRLQLEKQYRELTVSPKTKTFVRQLLEDSAKDAARIVARKAVSAGVELALGKAAAKATGNNKEFLELMVSGKKGNKGNKNN